MSFTLAGDICQLQPGPSWSLSVKRPKRDCHGKDFWYESGQYIATARDNNGAVVIPSALANEVLGIAIEPQVLEVWILNEIKNVDLTHPGAVKRTCV